MRRPFRLLLLSGLVTPIGCDAPSSPDVAGDVGLEAHAVHRTGFAGATDTLEVRVLRDGIPAPRVRVTWETSHGGIMLADEESGDSGVARIIWQLQATADTQRIVARAGDTLVSFSAHVPIARVSIDPAGASLWPEESVTLHAIATDGAGTELSWVPFWTASDAGVATIDASGVVRAVAPGRVSVRASAGSRADSAVIAVWPEGTTTTVHGRVHPLIAGAGLPSLLVTWRDSLGTGSAITSDDGTFALVLRHVPDAGDTALVLVEPTGTNALDYHPSVLFVPHAQVDEELVAVMIPTRWTIHSGIYHGVPRTISLNAALWNAPRESGFLGGTHHPQQARTFHIARTQWPDTAFPVAVFLAPRPDEAPFSASDSTHVWADLGRMEEILGVDLFHPATPPDGHVYPSVVPGAVFVSRSLNGGGVAGAQPGEWLSSQRSVPLHSPRMVLSLSRGDIVTAGVHVSFHAEGVFFVQHEMGHALGLGHGCAWVSLMTTCATAGTLWPASEMTPSDVAYYELARAAAARDRELGVEMSIVGAFMGERLLRLGLRILPVD